MDTQTRINVERDRGNFMYEGLADIFTELRINPSVIRSFGALCLDVEFGREIEAFRLFGAAKIIACEPDAAWGNKDDRATKFGVMACLGAGLDLRVLKLFAPSALEKLASEVPPVQVGAITNLNVFPDNIDPCYLEDIVRAGLPLLAPDGLVVVSAMEGPHYVMEKFEKAANAISDAAAVSCFDRSSTCAGTCFLVAHSARSVRPLRA